MSVEVERHSFSKPDGFAALDVRPYVAVFRQSKGLCNMKYGYARVSTDEQTTNLQVDALQNAGCDELFVDEGLSGMSQDRPQLQALLEVVSEGDAIMVWKMDRLTRSLKHLLDLSESLSLRQVDLVSLSDPIDTSTPQGKAFFRIMGVLSEMERDMIRERTIAGVRAAQARGKHCGRPRVLGQDQLVLARQMLSKGQSQRRVARVLKVSDATLSRRLKEILA